MSGCCEEMGWEMVNNKREGGKRETMASIRPYPLLDRSNHHRL